MLVKGWRRFWRRESQIGKMTEPLVNSKRSDQRQSVRPVRAASTMVKNVEFGKLAVLAQT